MNTISCVFGVTLLASCEGACRTWSWLWVLDQRGAWSRLHHPRTISPLLIDQPRRSTQPSPHACPGGRGEGGSMEISWGIFHSSNTGIPHSAWDLNLFFKLNTRGCIFFFSFREENWQDIFLTAEVIKFFFSITGAFELNKGHETNRFSFPAHFPHFYIQSALPHYKDSRSNADFGQGLLNFLR